MNRVLHVVSGSYSPTWPQVHDYSMWKLNMLNFRRYSRVLLLINFIKMKNPENFYSYNSENMFRNLSWFYLWFNHYSGRVSYVGMISFSIHPIISTQLWANSWHCVLIICFQGLILTIVVNDLFWLNVYEVSWLAESMN